LIVTCGDELAVRWVDVAQRQGVAQMPKMLAVRSVVILMKIIVDVLAGVFIMRISFGGNVMVRPKRRKRGG
jgi:hypothetical protein